ncbi:MAG TPA: aldolase/citrate lyase family protein [Steroidobacter sp.]|uniref:HpcH/HpaI aldolase family protein n=1 Tax=Steroidobacter sp. TaxID=1978227 RepID=UPI002ED7CB54
MWRVNRLKRALAANRSCLGAWLFSGDPAVAEIIGLERFDALIIDQEHSPNGIESTIAQMRAIAAAGDSTVLVRIPDIQPHFVKLALDAGAEGILAPKVESAEQARALVAACRYPPLGMRGAHYTVSRAARWGGAATDYLKDYRDELLIVAMIEGASGLQAANEIAGVDGIDMLFLGPLDLTADMGYMGQFDDPRLRAAFDALTTKLQASGKWLGSTTWPGVTASELMATGCSFVTVGSDVGFLQGGARAALAAAAR